MHANIIGFLIQNVIVRRFVNKNAATQNQLCCDFGRHFSHRFEFKGCVNEHYCTHFSPVEKLPLPTGLTLTVCHNLFPYARFLLYASFVYSTQMVVEQSSELC